MYTPWGPLTLTAPSHEIGLRIVHREQFARFTVDRIEELLTQAETKFNKAISREFRFRLGTNGEILSGSSSLDKLIDYIWLSDKEIYPFVDLLLDGLLEDRPIITVCRSGYKPRPFGTNWTGKPGPYILMIGDDL